jgi:hypothetical protein
VGFVGRVGGAVPWPELHRSVDRPDTHAAGLHGHEHRTAEDLPSLLARPGRIRLVKGAYDVPATEAVATGSEELARRFDERATELLTSGHPCTIATHDEERIAHARSVPAAGDYYFEVLQGIGETLVADLHAAGCQHRCTWSTARRSGCTCATAWRRTPGGWCRQRRT